jgi:hypothetical protein
LWVNGLTQILGQAKSFQNQLLINASFLHPAKMQEGYAEKKE